MRRLPRSVKEMDCNKSRMTVAVSAEHAAISKACSTPIILENEQLQPRASFPKPPRQPSVRLKLFGLPFGWTTDQVRDVLERELKGKVRFVAADTLDGVRLTSAAVFLDPATTPLPTNKIKIGRKTCIILDPRIPRQPRPQPQQQQQQPGNAVRPTTPPPPSAASAKTGRPTSPSQFAARASPGSEREWAKRAASASPNMGSTNASPRLGPSVLSDLKRARLGSPSPQQQA